MSRLKFDRDFTRPLGDDSGRSRTWPAGWEGLVEDEAVAREAVAEGAAAYVGPPASGAAAAAKAEIPADWKDLKADDMVALAHKLGAGGEVSTKAAAEEFIGKLAGDKQLV